MTQSMKYLNDAINAIFKKQCEVDKTNFIILKDAYNSQVWIFFK